MYTIIFNTHTKLDTRKLWSSYKNTFLHILMTYAQYVYTTEYTYNYFIVQV
jgi:hypothetical protein